MSRYNNSSEKTSFLKSLKEIKILNSDLSDRCKFNFSYFDNTQDPGASFDQMSAPDLATLLEKLRLYSINELNYWRRQRVGGSRSLRVLADYDSFPKKNTDFLFPKFVPADARWGRFRMDNLTRLIGFTIPAEMLGVRNVDGDRIYDSNTFYVVFIDPYHKFYKVEKK